MGYKEATLTFHEDKITYIGNPAEGFDWGDDIPHQELEVMMSWETQIMEKSAEFVCQNGGDILEIGFGMGIASDYIQSHNPESIIEGDWIEEIDSLGNFDGIFFDTYGTFGHWDDIAYKASEHTNSGCHITFWNCTSGEMNGCGFGDSYNISYEQISVSPPQNTYFNNSTYYMPKVII